MEGTNAVEKAEGELYLGTGAGTGVGEDALRRAMQGEEKAAVEEDAGQSGAVAVARDTVAVAATAAVTATAVEGGETRLKAGRAKEPSKRKSVLFSDPEPSSSGSSGMGMHAPGLGRGESDDMYALSMDVDDDTSSVDLTASFSD